MHQSDDKILNLCEFHDELYPAGGFCEQCKKDQEKADQYNDKFFDDNFNNIFKEEK